MDNRILEKESNSSFYVIVADRDGVKKYVSRDFPRPFQYTVKISKAHRFYTKDKAQDFIDGFNECGKYLIVNPKIKEVIRQFILSE